MKKLVVVADWAQDAVYCREYKSAITGFTKEEASIDISFIPTSISPIHTGFIVEQIVRTDERLGRPLNTVIHVGNEPKNQKADFLVMKLTSGLYLCGFNFIHIFSFVKNSIDEAFSYQLSEASSNFLSRDTYCRVVDYLLQSLQDDLQLEQVHLNTIVESEGHYIGHIDSFGNIITTITHNDLKGRYTLGDEIAITIGDKTEKAVYKKNLWSETGQQLMFAPSSFGSADNPYLALAIFEGSAATHFGRISPGMKVQL